MDAVRLHGMVIHLNSGLRVGDRTRTGDNQIHSLELGQRNPLHAATSAESPGRLDRALTTETGLAKDIDQDLSRIITAWPEVPEVIRKAILALVESGK
jgi:hypothetical protein